MHRSPGFKEEKFQCPHCEVLSQQRWFDLHSSSAVVTRLLDDVFYGYRRTVSDYDQEIIANYMGQVENVNRRYMSSYVPRGFSIATCVSCNEISAWVDEKIIYPKKVSLAPPNEDMDQKIKDLYFEASNIVGDSPKGATALLRLALQLLLQQLGRPGKNINSDIKYLVSEGLSPKIQQALDLLRVVGNNAVHPGQIDLDDGREIADKLFSILNYIADELLTKPRELERLYDEIVPDETRQHINERDGK